jgi:hypothetical protein
MLNLDQLVYEFGEIFGEKLQRKEDISRILELGFKSENFETIEKMAFTGKYLDGLFNIIKRGESGIDEEVFKSYVEEYTVNLEKFRNELEALLNYASDFIQDIFRKKYLVLSQEGVQNLTALIHDFNYLKIYLNDKKRN